MAKTKKRRRGRNRKPLPRTPSGQLSRSSERRVVEHAQSEHETKATLSELKNDRARGLGLTREQADNPISETIAGRMALRGVLSFTEAAAINEYAKLVRRAAKAMCAPAGTRCSLSLTRAGDGIDDPEIYAQIMRNYNEAFSVVRETGSRACMAVNLVVRDMREPPAEARKPLRAAALALARHFGIDERAAA